MTTVSFGWEQRLYKSCFIRVEKYVSYKRGTIGSHWNTNYLLDLCLKKKPQKLKHRYDVIFRVIAFGDGVIKMNYFSMSLLKIYTKTYKFRFESKHHGILNEKTFKVKYKLIIDQ